MYLASEVYRHSPDSSSKFTHLDKNSTDDLLALSSKYKSMLNNGRLMKNLKDGGESIRAKLSSIEEELIRRSSCETNTANVQALSSDSFPFDVEWKKSYTAAVPARQAAVPEVDSMNTADHVSTHSARSITHRMLVKSELGERTTLFRTNRARASVAPHSSCTAAPSSDSRPSMVERWADSSLATPGGVHARTFLLNMSESLQLLTKSSEQIEAERMDQLSRRLNQVHFDENNEDEVENDDEIT